MNKQSAHGLKGLRTYPANAANVISSLPVCDDDDCMQCAMGLYCTNAPKPEDKPRLRVSANWTAAQIENEMIYKLLKSEKPRAIVPTWYNLTASTAVICTALVKAAGGYAKAPKHLLELNYKSQMAWSDELLSHIS